MRPAIFFSASLLLAFPMSSAAQDSAAVHKPGNGVSAPVLVSDVKPQYPLDALLLEIEGHVKLEGVVETDGSVSQVRVVRSPDPSLDEAAVAALEKWRFKPGMKDGAPVRVLVDVEMAFAWGGNEPRLDSSDVFKPGAGVSAPRVLKEIKPLYTQAARDAGIQGIVILDCVVKADGRVGHTRVTRRLDPDLDREAIRALKQWRFAPGERQGKPVPVQVFVEISFTLK